MIANLTRLWGSKALFPHSLWNVAQLAEHPAVNRRVGGSSPPIPAVRLLSKEGSR